MSTAVANTNGRQQEQRLAPVERCLIQGDLSQLNDTERVQYYQSVCESLGLNPLTKPFEYLQLKDDKGGAKLVLYATRACTDQLRQIHQVSIRIKERRFENGLYIVVAEARSHEREDEATGVVPTEKENGTWQSSQNGKRFFQGDGTFTQFRGDALANCLMKAETKAKRRVTLSICGLGWLDETEIDTIPHATPLVEIAPQPQLPAKTPTEAAKAILDAAGLPVAFGADIKQPPTAKQEPVVFVSLEQIAEIEPYLNSQWCALADFFEFYNITELNMIPAHWAPRLLQKCKLIDECEQLGDEKGVPLGDVKEWVGGALMQADVKKLAEVRAKLHQQAPLEILIG